MGETYEFMRNAKRAVVAYVESRAMQEYLQTLQGLSHELYGALATQVGKKECTGGFWTPATLLGAQLRARLVKHAGMRFTVVEPPSV